MAQAIWAIQTNDPIAQGIYAMALGGDAPLARFAPGMFAHVALPGSTGHILRRPISICTADAQAPAMTLIYQVVGEGTRILSGLAPGAKLDILAPLGRGFSMPKGVRRAALIGGGVGIAPLLGLFEAYADVEFDAFLGYRSRSHAYLVDEFVQRAAQCHICTDDGSLGERGFCIQPFARMLPERRYDAIFTCGPRPMLCALQALLRDYPQLPCQLSMEERMACGFGACLTCVCKIAQQEGWAHKRVCSDGPVFNLAEVRFD